MKEFIWDKKPSEVPLNAIAGLVVKLTKQRIPGSSDHPAVETLRLFQVPAEAVPESIRQRFLEGINAFVELGFIDPVWHVISDALHSTRIVWVTLRHQDGTAMARVHHRLWEFTRPPRDYLFPVIFTAFEDGTWQLTSGGKPDTLEAPCFRVTRLPGANVEAVWHAHQAAVAAQASRPLRAVGDRTELCERIEECHAALRDFHLRRGFFKPLSADDRARQERQTQDTSPNAVVVQEMHELATSKPGWGNFITILLISAGAFLLASGKDRDWKYVAMIVPILFLHELGHYVAMRVFGYRNLRMFFIPGLGAAVSGKNFNVSGWKKAIVALAGPVPSILFAAGFGAAGIVRDQSWMVQVGFLSVIVNAFNLLPFLPLDGGHVMQALVFSRHHVLETLFRVAAGVSMLLLAYALGAPFLGILGALSLVAAPQNHKLARLAGELRRANIPLPEADSPDIPRSTAETIIDKVRQISPPKTNNRTLAQQALNIFENLNARPPGWAGTLALLAAHGITVVVALVAAGVFAVHSVGGDAKDNIFHSFGKPEHELNCAHLPGPEPEPGATEPPSRLLIAQYDTPSQASAGAAALAKASKPGARTQVFGSTAFVLVPADDEALRDGVVNELESLTTNVVVVPNGRSAVVNLNAKAASAEQATRLNDELTAYLSAPDPMQLVPPWVLGKRLDPATADGLRDGRSFWHQLNQPTGQLWTNASFKTFTQQIQTARRRGRTGEAQRLEKQRDAELERLRIEAIRALEPQATNALRRQLYEARLALPPLNHTNQTYLDAIGAVGALLGATSTNGTPTAAADRALAAKHGISHAIGQDVELRFPIFEDVSRGLPALARWLCDQGCSGIRYEIHANLDDLVEEPE